MKFSLLTLLFVSASMWFSGFCFGVVWLRWTQRDTPTTEGE